MNREQWLQKLHQYTQHPSAVPCGVAGSSAAAAALVPDARGRRAPVAAALLERNVNEAPGQGKS